MKIIRILSIATVCAIASFCQIARAQNNVGNFYMGEVKVEVISRYSGAQMLPKAEKVLIQDFTVDTGVVSMDKSAAGRIHTQLFLRRDPDDASAPVALSQQVQASFSKALINDLRKSDIEVQRSTGTQGGSDGSLLVVSGEVTAIDEGNKVKRVMVGLGRGGSNVQTHVVVSSVVNGHSTVVLELNLKSESGKKLGALESMGGGSLALNAAEGDIGDRNSSVQADASRMAKGVAKQIQKFMVAQNWIPATPPDGTHPAPAFTDLLAQSTP
jgi:hypothetical protein